MKQINYTDQPAVSAEVTEIIKRILSEIEKLSIDNRLVREEMAEQTLILQDEIAEQGLATQQSITAVLQKEMRDQKQELIEIISESTEGVLQAVAHHTHNLEDSIRDDIAVARDRLNRHIKLHEAGGLQML